MDPVWWIRGQIVPGSKITTHNGTGRAATHTRDACWGGVFVEMSE